MARDALPVLAGAAIFLAAWKLIVLFGDFRPFVLPAPEVVAARLLRAWTDGTIEPHVATTLREIALGFVVGAGLALPVGYLLARSQLAARVISPYLVAAQATPILALAPLIALWFGTGLASKVIICALIVFFPVAVATMVGIRSVDGELLEMGRAFRASRAQVVTLLEIPGALPSIFGGLRVGATLAVIGAIIGEWAGGQTGLGVLINLARGSLFDTPLLFATLVTIAAMGVLFYTLIIVVERRLVGSRG
ncbi:MAG: ABC transporter permease [Chloroflexota bacterium]|nr:ABC transporter permease [Chloroflexota bacterium]